MFGYTVCPQFLTGKLIRLRQIVPVGRLDTPNVVKCGSDHWQLIHYNLHFCSVDYKKCNDNNIIPVSFYVTRCAMPVVEATLKQEAGKGFLILAPSTTVTTSSSSTGITFRTRHCSSEGSGSEERGSGLAEPHTNTGTPGSIYSTIGCICQNWCRQYKI